MRSFTLQSSVLIESFLLESVGLAPRSKLKKAFLDGAVFVNGKPVRREHLLQVGDRVEIRAPYDELLFTKDEIQLIPNSSLLLQVLVENPEFVAINKPAGQNAHPLHPSEKDTAVSALVARYPEIFEVGIESKHPLEGGLVHRLDRGTSGILICARTFEAWEKLKKNWGGVEKVYLAWVEGDARSLSGRVELFLAHDPKSKKKMRAHLVAPRGEKSWAAMTSFHALQKSGNATLLLIRIYTGVTHQIRATLAYLGHPVVGDEIYAGAKGGAKLVLSEVDAETIRIFEMLKKKIPALPQPSPLQLQKRAFFLHALWLRMRASDTDIFASLPSHF